LVANALELSPRMNEISIQREGKIGTLEPRLATPLALVVTELIHNSLEHGLAAEGTELRINVERGRHECTIRIHDNGVGLPADFEITTSSNLGLQIVRTLTENELQGELALLSQEHGTLASVTFPL